MAKGKNTKFIENEQTENSDQFLLFYNTVCVSSGLSVHECGWEKCYPSHFYGPSTRKYFILHYIIEGKGTYEVGQMKYHLGPNQVFIIPPNLETYYEADKEDPWHYYWIGFHGTEAEHILRLAGFFDENNLQSYYCKKVENNESLISSFKEVCKYNHRTIQDSYFMLGNLYIILSLLMNSNGQGGNFRTKDYVDEAIRYIEKNFMLNINVTDICKHLGIDRTYFYKIFKEKMKMSPQEWLLNTKLTKAKILIKDTDLSLKNIAITVGFKDYANFSKMFKLKFRQSPLQYKKLPSESNNNLQH